MSAPARLVRATACLLPSLVSSSSSIHALRTLRLDTKYPNLRICTSVNSSEVRPFLALLVYYSIIPTIYRDELGNTSEIDLAINTSNVMWGLEWIWGRFSRVFSTGTHDPTSVVADDTTEISTTRHRQHGSLFFQNSTDVIRADRTSLPDRPPQNSPLLRLPTELRLAIYNFSLQHIFNETVARAKLASEHDPPPTRKPQPFLPSFLGALALPHTSHTLRDESVDFLSAHMLPEVKTMMAAADNFNATITSESPTEDVVEGIALHRAATDADHLLDVLTVFHYSQVCLRRPSSHFPWSLLGYEQKRLVALGWLMGLPLCEQRAMHEVLDGEGDKCGLLVRAIDARVEADKREQGGWIE